MGISFFFVVELRSRLFGVVGVKVVYFCFVGGYFRLYGELVVGSSSSSLCGFWVFFIMLRYRK